MVTATKAARVNPFSRLPSFLDYEIMAEYKNLQHENQCPPGIYLMPKINAIREFEGVYFVRSGPFKEAIIRFILILPGYYPTEGIPKIRIISRFVHPLLSVADKGFDFLKATKKVSDEPVRVMRITTVLGMFAECFDELFMYGLEESQCLNPAALQLLKNDRMAFDEETQNCIQESIEFAKNCRTGSICLGAAPPPSNSQ